VEQYKFLVGALVVDALAIDPGLLSCSWKRVIEMKLSNELP
jgi:hypothetical protein